MQRVTLVKVVLLVALATTARADDVPPLSPELATELAEAEVDDLVEIYLEEPDETIRVGAARELARRKVATSRAIKGLLLALDDSSDRVRRAVARSLAELGTEPVEGLLGILESMTATDKDRRLAIHALARLGPTAGPAAPRLLKLLTDEADPVRSDVADTLGAIGLDSPEILHGLEVGLRRPYDREQPAAQRAMFDRHRHACARALARLGPSGVRALRAALLDDDRRVRNAVVVPLSSVAFNEAFIPLLVSALGDEDGNVRNDAAHSLGRMGGAAVDALPHLISKFDDERTSTAKWAVRTIGRDLLDAGRAEWWLLPRVFWRESLAVSVLVLAWWVASFRVLRVRRMKLIAILLIVGVLPTTTAVLSAAYGASREWVGLVLPAQYPFSGIPLVGSVGVTVGLMTLLTSIAITRALGRRAASHGTVPERDGIT